jgi:hypothetical protein
MSDTSLTGAIDTGRISKIADQPVTVTVSRTPLPEREVQFEQWAERAVQVLDRFPGSLGIGVLRPGTPGGEWHMVFRFVDGIALRNWERSPQRAALQAELAGVAEDMKVQRTVGVDNWFDLPERALPRAGFVKRLLGDALWVYPVSLAMAVFVSPLLPPMNLGLRVLVTGLVLGLVSQLTVRPLLRRIRQRRQLG